MPITVIEADSKLSRALSSRHSNIELAKIQPRSTSTDLAVA
jgi:hypothetical protein